MRIIEKKEFRITCLSCGSVLGVNSGDIKFRLGMKYIVCPVCKEYNIIN